jgi:hypothetical protein
MAADQSIVTAEQMRQLLRRAFAANAEASLIWQLARKAKDPLKPEDSKSRKRFHPILILYTALVLTALGAFLYSRISHP